MEKTAKFKKGPKINPKYIKYFFILPAIFYIALFTIYPTIRIIFMSFTELVKSRDTSIFVGLSNYKLILTDPVFYIALKNTLYFIGVGTLGHIGLGVLVALLLNSKLNRTVINVSRSLILLPWVLSPTVIAAITQLWAHPLFSPIAKFLEIFKWTGVFEPLGSTKTALLTLTIVNIWQYMPFYMLMILAKLQTIDQYIIDAAKVDGVNSFQQFVYITWPHIRNVVLTFTLFALVSNAAYFDLIWVSTKGGPVRSTEVLATYLYRKAFLGLDWSESSVIAVLLLVISFSISAIVIKLMKKE